MAAASKYSEGTAAAKRLADRLKEAPDAWVACRDMMHAWATLNDFHVSGRHGKVLEIRRDLVCMRCETVRHEDYDATKAGLEKVRQSYTYPRGYQFPGVPRGVKPKAIVQQEQYRRAMERVAKAAAGERDRER